MSKVRFQLPESEASLSDIHFQSNLIAQEAIALDAAYAQGTLALESLSIHRPQRQLLQKLIGLVDDVSGFINVKMTALLPKNGHADISDLVRQINKTNYMDISHIRVPVPVGMSSTWLDYLAVLQECTDVAVRLYEEVLYPFQLFVGQAVNNPAIVSNSSFQHSVRPHDLTPLKKKLALVKGGSEDATMAYGKAVKRNADWAAVSQAADRLIKTQQTLPADLVKRTVDEIDHSMKQLLNGMNDTNQQYRPSAEVISQLAELCNLLAEEVTFYSAVIALNAAAITALEQTPESLKTILKA